MRSSRLLFLVAIAVVAWMPGGPAAAEPARPYKAVAVRLPQPVQDPSFEAFRKQLVGISKRKDRAALAKLIVRNFFWMIGDRDATDHARTGIENLATALDLDAPDTEGWDSLAILASDPTADPSPSAQGVICGPADPVFDAAEAEAVAKDADTSTVSWFYPLADGLEVRAGPTSSDPVIGKLGMHLVLVFRDSPVTAVQPDFLQIVMPSGQTGFVPVEALAALPADLVCYIKEGNAWRIAGVVGFEPGGR